MSGLLTGKRMQYEVGEAVPKGGGSMKFGILSLLDHYLEDKSEEQYYKDFFEEVVYAEELGFEAVWIGEHHFGRYICPSPQVVAGALARYQENADRHCRCSAASSRSRSTGG